MSKRARGAGGRFINQALTGGTGDVKPQWTSGSVTQAAVEEYAAATFVLPVARIGTRMEEAMVFEILRMDWYPGIQNLADTNVTEWCYISTRTVRDTGETASLVTLAADVGNPNVIGLIVSSRAFTTSGASIDVLPFSIDMTDSAGNGMLVATDRLILNCAATGNAVVATYGVKILYRLVNVGVMEYVGIVQSQN